MKVWQKLLTVLSLFVICISVGVTAFSSLEVSAAQKEALKCENEMESLAAEEKNIQEKEAAVRAETEEEAEKAAGRMPEMQHQSQSTIIQ